MMISTHVVPAARAVRAASLALAMSILVGFVAVQAFASQYGTPVRTVDVDATSGDRVLASAVRAQESAGLTCSDEPVLTDVVLFQRLHSDRVVVMSFAEAIAASGDREGWIRRYCS